MRLIVVEREFTSPSLLSLSILLDFVGSRGGDEALDKR